MQADSRKDDFDGRIQLLLWYCGGWLEDVMRGCEDARMRGLMIEWMAFLLDGDITSERQFCVCEWMHALRS